MLPTKEQGVSRSAKAQPGNSGTQIENEEKKDLQSPNRSLAYKEIINHIKSFWELR
jgi:hypothetical protein